MISWEDVHLVVVQELPDEDLRTVTCHGSAVEGSKRHPILVLVIVIYGDDSNGTEFSSMFPGLKEKKKRDVNGECSIGLT